MLLHSQTHSLNEERTWVDRKMRIVSSENWVFRIDELLDMEVTCKLRTALQTFHIFHFQSPLKSIDYFPS